MKHPKVLIMGYVWPEAQSSAAGLRDWNLIETFQSAGWEITYVSAAKENEFSRKVQAKGITTATIQANESQHFDRFIQELNPDYVIFDRFITEEQFGWKIDELCPKCIKVLDSQDLHFLRRRREQAANDGLSLSEIKDCRFDLLTETALREIASIFRCDTTLILSDFEMSLLIKEFSVSPALLHLTRFHYSSPTISSSAFIDRSDFMMIGNFRHAPNSDGIKWFNREVWPGIRKSLPTINVSIYGAYPPKNMMQLTNRESGFHVMGPVVDQFEAFRRHRVNLAPLRFGAGIKGKITDGWWAGTPVIATAIGAEGMHENLPWGGEIAEDADDFIKKAVQLYTNESIWLSAQANGFNILEKLYLKPVQAPLLVNHLLAIAANVELARKANVVGAMLRHHHHRSTKYFSKWIEAKNQGSNSGSP